MLILGEDPPAHTLLPRAIPECTQPAADTAAPPVTEGNMTHCKIRLNPSRYPTVTCTDVHRGHRPGGLWQFQMEDIYVSTNSGMVPNPDNDPTANSHHTGNTSQCWVNDARQKRAHT